jgi:hypothetical protein
MRHPYVFTALVLVCCQVGAVHQFYSASVLAKSQKVGLESLFLVGVFCVAFAAEVSGVIGTHCFQIVAPDCHMVYFHILFVLCQFFFLIFANIYF